MARGRESPEGQGHSQDETGVPAASLPLLQGPRLPAKWGSKSYVSVGKGETRTVSADLFVCTENSTSKKTVRTSN